jgi:tetratricopeptide (TPR) repeat protein
MTHGMDRSGRVIALPNYHGALVYLPDRVLSIGPTDGDTRLAQVSDDGRWLVTCSHGGIRSGVWNLADGSRVAELSTGGLADAGGSCFSPDGRYLMTNGDACRLWNVGDWTESRVIAGHGLAFTPDGKVVAVCDERKILTLVECDSGRILARFEDPDQIRAATASFSPDGSKLIVVTPDNPSARVWDLRAIRRRLAEMGLDWKAPGYPDDQTKPMSIERMGPVSVDYGDLVERAAHADTQIVPPEILLDQFSARLKRDLNDAEAYHHRGHALAKLQRFREAIADCETSLRLRPGQAELSSFLAELCNDRAWRLAAVSSPANDHRLALSLARRAVELVPGETFYLNTLGVCLFRDARYDEAAPVLERSLAASRGEADAHDLLFLAMARHRLGDAGAARADFDRALRWIEAHPNLRPEWIAELRAFRAEAEALLAGPAGELPADVFASEGP